MASLISGGLTTDLAQALADVKKAEAVQLARAIRAFAKKVPSDLYVELHNAALALENWAAGE